MGLYKTLVIYYFSGTGNSRNVASWVSDVASQSGIAAKIINIANVDRRNIETPPSGSLIVFVSPIHGFNYPPVMLSFITHFPRGNNHVLLMNTRAGMLIGKFITPGLTGLAFYLSAFILRIKGYSIRGMVPVDLPSNWISIHPGLNDRTIKYLHQKNKERVARHAEKVLAGQKDFIALREIIQDIAVAPISLGYFLIGRFFLAKTFYASGDCDNCGACINNCPVKAIILKNDRPYWTFKCESCMRCMSNCPKRAIETAHGFVIAFLLVESLVLVPLIYKCFDMAFFTSQSMILDYVVRYSILFLFLALSYRFIHYCMRFHCVERCMVYTSLTWYKWWGRRYKALKK
ncbi:MAG: yjjW [Bacteroidetes bacterium]|nr:yjjW [Bacteroidota bacterium]